MTDERTDAEILRAAAARIADRGHFVLGALAWDRAGRTVDPQSPEAWRWNARGAICAESGIRPIDCGKSSLSRPTERLYALLDAAATAVAEANEIRFPAGTDLADNIDHPLSLQALEDAARAADGEAPA